MDYLLEIKSDFDNIISKGMEVFSENTGKNIFNINRKAYIQASRKFFFFIFDSVNLQSELSGNLEAYNSAIYEYYLDLNSNRELLFELIQNISRILRKEYFTRLSQDIYKNTIIKYDLIFDYILSVASNIINFNFVPQNIAKDYLFLAEQYRDYTENTAEFTNSKLIKYARIDKNFSYTSSIFKEKFIDKLNRNIENSISQFSSKLEEIAYFIADSGDYVPKEEINDLKNIPKEVLRKSWGGEGLALYENLLDIYEYSKLLGRSENSFAGKTEMLNDFIAILVGASYGEKLAYEFFQITPNKNFLGEINDIYFTRSRDENTIAGIDFLRSFNLLKSFTPETQGDKIFNRYKDGIKRFFSFIQYKNENKQKTFYPKILQEINKNLLFLGNISKNISNILDSGGKLQEYEGLGSLKYIIDLFVKVFPDIEDRFINFDKFQYTGLLGAIQNLSFQLSRLENLIPLEGLDSEYFDFIQENFRFIKTKLEYIISVISVTGYEKGQFIPNLDLEPSPRTKKDIVDLFISQGYSDIEAEQIASSRNIDDLMRKFSFKIDSSDIKSILKGYDFLSGVYLIGGEKEIFNIFNFLSNRNEDGLRRIFEHLTKNKDKYLKWDSYRFGELVGTLINIYPSTSIDNLEGYYAIIKSQDKDIAEAINTAYQFFREEDLNLNLDLDFISSLATLSKDGEFRDKLDYYCKDLLKKDPLALRRFISLIDSSIGSASQEEIIGLLNEQIGITPNELSNFLNIKDNPGFSLLGGILSGLRGGNFSELIKNTYFSGLMHVFSTKSRKKANEIINDETVSIRDLFFNLERLNLLFKILNENLNISRPISTKILGRNNNIDLIIKSASREMDIYENLFSYLSPDLSLNYRFRVNNNDYRDRLSKMPPKHPPGLGNSPLVVKTTQGTLSPELAYYFQVKKGKNPFIFHENSTSKFLNRNTFIKLDTQKESIQFRGTNQSKLVPEGTNLTNLSYFEPSEEDKRRILLSSLKTLFNNNVADQLTLDTQNQILIEINRENYLPQYEKVGKTTFYRKPNITVYPSQKHNPVDYCEKMGSNNKLCENLYQRYLEIDCENKYLSHNYIVENYNDPPVFNRNNIPISRPWGFSGDLSPQVFNTYKNPPKYWNSLDLRTKKSNSKGEPIDFNISRENLSIPDYNLKFLDFFRDSYIKRFGSPYLPIDCTQGDIYDRSICLNIVNSSGDPPEDKKFPLTPLTLYVPYNDDYPLPLRSFNYAIDSSIGRIDFQYKRNKDFLQIVINNIGDIEKLKLTNTGITLWEDNWIENGKLAFPKIKHLILNNSELLEDISLINIGSDVEILELNNCPNLKYVNVKSSNSLEEIYLNNNSSLSEVKFGLNPNLRIISLKNCNLNEETLESIISDIYPCKSHIDFIFPGKIKYSSVLDLSGNFIPWSNYHISSKIRMLLANNFRVIWSNDPPSDIIPVQYYKTIDY